MADQVADTLTLKRAFGWKSDTVAEGYVRESKRFKSDIANTIFGEPEKKENKPAAMNFTFYNCPNLTIVMKEDEKQ